MAKGTALPHRCTPNLRTNNQHSVIQRQLHLKQHQKLSHHHAYDVARKEFYTHRHVQDIERRLAREEALHTGAYFMPGPNAIAEPLEDAQFDRWKEWAAARVNALKNARMAGYSGVEVEEDEGTGEVKVSAIASTSAEEEGGLGKVVEEVKEEVPETSQGAVADAVQDSKLRSR